MSCASFAFKRRNTLYSWRLLGRRVMRKIKERLLYEQKMLTALLAKSNKNIAKYKNVPNLHVQVATRKGYEQYYLYNPETNSRKYIKHEDLKLYNKNMQRDYELTVNRKLQIKVKAIEKAVKYIDRLNLDDIRNIYADMPSLKREKIIPIIESKEGLIEKWREEHPGGRNPFPEEGKYQTNRGELVRSKSEKIIADTLDKCGIPYEYEPLVELSNYHSVYPDFVALNIRTGETIIWEHLGLLSDGDYAVKNFNKLQEYESNGYLMTGNLIVTMESADIPFDVGIVDKKIKAFLL